MKKIICFLVFGAMLTSCSNEDQIIIKDSDPANFDYSLRTMSTDSLTEVELQDVIEASKDVFDSQEWKQWRAQSIALVSKYNNMMPSDSDVQSNSSFVAWVATNIDSTSFTSVSDASKEYEDMIAAGIQVATLYRDFYISLNKASDNQRRLIFAPVTVPPITVPAQETPCQASCGDKVFEELEFTQWLYDQAIDVSIPVGENVVEIHISYSEERYHARNNESIRNYNACLANCDK